MEDNTPHEVIQKTVRSPGRYHFRLMLSRKTSLTFEATIPVLVEGLIEA